MNRELKPEELEFLEYIRIEEGVLPNTNGQKIVGFDFIYGDYFYINKNKENDQIQYCKDKESFKKLLQEQVRHLEVDSHFFNCICNKLKGIRIVFNPHSSEMYEIHGDRYFNTFSTNGSKLSLRNIIKERIANGTAERHDISFLNKYPFISVLLKNVMNNNAEHVEYFINWLSCALNELDKNMTAIALIGAEEGTGKGVTEEFLLRYIYGDLLATMSNSELNSDFNHLTDEKMFLILNEIKADLKDSKMVAEKLKMMITDKNTAISRKFKDTVIKRNYYNCMLFSNEALPVKIGENDRRWTVFNTSSIKLIHIAATLGYTMYDFLEKIKEERDSFVYDLFLYKYSKQRAQTVLNTELKDLISENTSTKIEILAAKIKKMDSDWIVGKLEETVSKNTTLAQLNAGIERLLEEFGLGLVSTDTLVFLYKRLVDLEDLTDYKISQKFQQYLGSANVSRGGKRYRNLKKSNISLDYIKEEFISTFKSEKEIISENVKDFEEKKENEVSNTIFLELLERNMYDKFATTKFVVFEKEYDDYRLNYFSNEKGNKYTTKIAKILSSEEELVIVEKIGGYKIPF